MCASPTYERCGTFDPSPTIEFLISTCVPAFEPSFMTVPGRTYAHGPMVTSLPIRDFTTTENHTLDRSPIRESRTRLPGPISHSAPIRASPSRNVRGWIRVSLPMQGLVVVPLFGGYDQRQGQGRIFFYDATGGRWEEDDFQTTGSGGLPAKNSLKKRWRAGLARDEAIRVAVEALFDAAEDDSATGGPDLARKSFPNLVTVTTTGAEDVPEHEVAAAVEALQREGT